VAWDKVADAAMARERFGEARLAYGESLQIVRALVASAPHDATLRRDLVLALMGVAAACSADADALQAERYLLEALPLARELATAVPVSAASGASPLAQRDLCLLLSRLGDLAYDAGRWGIAAAYFDEALSMDRTLLLRSGRSVAALQDLAASLDRVGNVASARGRLDAARRHYTEALSLLEEADAITGTVSSARAETHTKLAFALGELRETAAAQRHNEAAERLVATPAPAEGVNR
jgi:tetratricopeptide (TPR) repeat protein